MSPNLSIEYVDINSITPYEHNARAHKDADVEAIKNSILKFGFKDPIGVWHNTIVEGHGRLIAAKALGMDKVPVIRLDDLTDEQRKAYALAHNKTAELSDWDWDVLASELEELSDFDMSEFGFDVPEIGDEDEQDAEDENDLFDDVEKLENHYGVPYQGNKSRIADIIIKVLPPGERLVDLFGGGGAVTHCAMLSGKWNRFLYNDINKMITTLFLDAIHGKYHDERRVITREDFAELKDSDPYVKYIWSFGNNGLAYLWGKEIEEIKCTACHSLMDETLNERRLAYMHYVKMFRKRLSDNRLEPVERLQSLEHLQGLQQLEALQRLEALNMSYEDYIYEPGDVVYCDVPYEQLGKAKCDDYGVNFDSKEFYRWVKSRPYQVFFSSYEISDHSFYKIKLKEIQSLIGANTNGKKVNEYLYSNRPIEDVHLRPSEE